MFKIGLSGQMFDDVDIWEHLNSAAEYGYQTVEIRSTHVKPGITDEEIEKINSFLKANNITVSALSCFTGNYGLLSDEDAKNAFQNFKEYVLLAVKLNASMIRVWAAWQESEEADNEVWEKAAYWMRKSALYAKEYDKKIVMEMHHGTLCDRAKSSLKLLKMIDCDNVGLTLDPVNLYQVPENYTQETIRLLGKHIFNVHIKDIARIEKDESEYAFSYGYYAKHIGRFTPVRYTPKGEERYFEHRCIGKGKVDWENVIKGLKEINYCGAIVVESVSEGNKNMPSLKELARVCIEDVKKVIL